MARDLRQRVEVFAGRYWQEGFDASTIGGLRYEYRYEWDRRGALFARAGRDRRTYDGAAEFQTFVELGFSYAPGSP